MAAESDILLAMQKVINTFNKLSILYYVDEDMILEAIARKSFFNLIHLKNNGKIDVFIRKDKPFDNEMFNRKRKDTLEGTGKSIACFFSSPEDIIIYKLMWYRDGDEVSERRWPDLSIKCIFKNGQNIPIYSIC